MELGEKIIALRRSKNMTQSELGSKLNVTFQAVSKWERGESYPDFDTLSKMAKIFGVSIGYFETDEDESTDGMIDGVTVAATSGEKQIIGFCKECGKVVYENEEACTTPAVICKACAVRRENAKRIAEKERIAKEKKAAQDAERARAARVYDAHKRRNRGLIWSSVICAVLIILGLIGMSKQDGAIEYLYFFLGAIIIYTFIAQLFWNGIVVRVCLCGGKIVGMPGVIFTLDLDGLIFLVGVKLLFALIKFLIFILSFVVMAVVALYMSPFTFVPQLLKLNKGMTL